MKNSDLLRIIGLILLIILLSVGLFCGILCVGNKFIKAYGPGELKLNDIIIYTVYIVQLVVTAILSALVYNLSRNTTKRELKSDKINKINALKYIKNEVNYNRSIVIVLENRNVSMDKISRYVFKMDAWNKYSVTLIDLLRVDQYNKVLSYYSTIQLYGTKELEKEIIMTVKEIGELEEMLDKKINNMERNKG